MSPPIWIVSGVSAIGMLLLFLFTAPLQAEPTLRYREGLFSVTSALSTSAIITVTLQANPASQQDFRFHGDLGDFSLDHSDLNDEDTVTQIITFSVAPGTYRLIEEVPITWHLSQIDCSLTNQVDVRLITGEALLTLNAGDQMNCIFVNERGVTIRTRSYHDADGNRAYSLGEQYASGREITVYKDQNIVMGVQLTNQYGKANFNYLPAGEYAACETEPLNWTNSQPGLVDATYGNPCYTFALLSGEVATLWFGNQQPGDTAPVTLPTSPRAIAVVQGADVASDNNGYDDWTFVDTDMNQDDRPPSVFLPLAFAQ
jgi:hypothetical protein